MKKLHLSVLPALMLTTLAACASSSPSMVTNPKTGETASCAVTAMTRTVADYAASTCQENYVAAGWVSMPGQVAESTRTAGF